MKFSKEGKGLGQLLIKYHKKKTTHIEPQATIEQPLHQINRSDKYSNDYSQFEKLSKTLEAPSDQPKQTKPKSNNPTQYFAHTHDKRKQRELFQKSTQQKLQNAQYFKNQGNKAYSDKQYQKASYCYQKALIHFDYTFPQTPEQQSKMKELQQKCHQNMGICLYKLNSKQQSTFHLKQTLKYNEQNIKALFTLARINLDAGEFEECQQLIQLINIYSKNNQEANNLLVQLRKKKQKYSDKLKKVSQMMFTK